MFTVDVKQQYIIIHSLLTLLHSERPKHCFGRSEYIRVNINLMVLLVLWKEFHISFKNISLISSEVDEKTGMPGESTS